MILSSEEDKSRFDRNCFNMTQNESCLQVMPKRTNKPGITSTNRPPRGRGFRGGRARGRGFGGGYMRRPRGGYRGRGNYYSPYWWWWKEELLIWFWSIMIVLCIQDWCDQLSSLCFKQFSSKIFFQDQARMKIGRIFWFCGVGNIQYFIDQCHT